MRNKSIWKKLDLLYVPSNRNSHPKLISHAANPLAVYMQGDLYRVFFSGRDAQNKSSVGAVDINIVERKIIQEYLDPFFYLWTGRKLLCRWCKYR